MPAAQPERPHTTRREHPAQGVIFFVHMVPRFITDFGAVARHLVAGGVPTTIYAPITRSDSAAGWARKDLADGYLAAVPADAELRPLPLDRERLSVLGVVRTMLLTLALGRRRPHSIFVLWTIIPIIVCGLPLRLMGRRCVFLVTGLGSVFGSDKLRFRIVRPFVAALYATLFSARDSRVIVHNHEDKAFLCDLGVPPDHVAVTPGCGVDPEEFPFLEHLPRRTKKVVLVPVRLLREKGVLDAVAASALLDADGVSHEMWFSSSIDPGNPSSLSPSELEQAKISSPSIRFIGFQQSLVPAYEACDVVCIPTRYREGLPTALLEAAACGRPLVATDNIGCREFVDDETTGLVVPTGSPRPLADAIRRLLVDERLANRLRLAAHDRYRRGFTKADMLDITVGVLRDLGLRTSIDSTLLPSVPSTRYLVT